MKHQPEHKRGCRRKQDAVDRKYKRWGIHRPRRVQYIRVCVVRQEPKLLGQITAESFVDLSKLLCGIHHRLDCRPFFMEGDIWTVEVMLDEGVKAAAVIEVRDLLKRREILQHLIQVTANALAVLDHEARRCASGENTADE